MQMCRMEFKHDSPRPKVQHIHVLRSFSSFFALFNEERRMCACLTLPTSCLSVAFSLPVCPQAIVVLGVAARESPWRMAFTKDWLLSRILTNAFCAPHSFPRRQWCYCWCSITEYDTKCRLFDGSRWHTCTLTSLSEKKTNKQKRNCAFSLSMTHRQS